MKSYLRSEKEPKFLKETFNKYGDEWWKQAFLAQVHVCSTAEKCVLRTRNCCWTTESRCSKRLQLKVQWIRIKIGSPVNCARHSTPLRSTQPEKLSPKVAFSSLNNSKSSVKQRTMRITYQLLPPRLLILMQIKIEWIHKFDCQLNQTF